MNKRIKPFNRNATKENPNTFTKDDVKDHLYHFDKSDYPILSKEFESVVLETPWPELVRRDSIGNDLGADHPNQKARRGGSVSQGKYNKLLDSFDIGIDHKRPCPVGYRDNNGDISYVSGHTRDRIYEGYHFEKIPLYVYKDRPGFDNEEILKFELLKMGQMSQDWQTYSNDPSQLDAVQFGLLCIQDGFISSDDTAPLEIRKLLEEAYQGRYFSKDRLTRIVHTIISQAPSLAESVTVRPMWNDTARAWMSENNYIDTPTTLYRVAEYTMAIKHYARGVNLAKANPSKNVRLVFHAGVLDGLKPKDQFEIRQSKGWNDIQSFVDGMRMIVFNNTPAKPKNLKVYGMIPQIGSLHNFRKLCIFDQTTGEIKKRA